jgi:hypothetical protein
LKATLERPVLQNALWQNALWLLPDFFYNLGHDPVNDATAAMPAVTQKHYVRAAGSFRDVCYFGHSFPSFTSSKAH